MTLFSIDRPPRHRDRSSTNRTRACGRMSGDFRCHRERRPHRAHRPARPRPGHRGRPRRGADRGERRGGTRHASASRPGSAHLPPADLRRPTPQRPVAGPGRRPAGRARRPRAPPARQHRAPPTSGVTSTRTRAAAGIGTALLDEAMAVARDGRSHPRLQRSLHRHRRHPRAGAVGLRADGRRAVRRTPGGPPRRPPSLWDRLYDEATTQPTTIELVHLVGPTPDDLLGRWPPFTRPSTTRRRTTWTRSRALFDADRVRELRPGDGRTPADRLSGDRAPPASRRVGRDLDAVRRRVLAVAGLPGGHLGRPGAPRATGSGLLMKTDMLRWVIGRAARGRAADTWNATSNHHMIAVNERLGATVVAEHVGYRLAPLTPRSPPVELAPDRAHPDAIRCDSAISSTSSSAGHPLQPHQHQLWGSVVVRGPVERLRVRPGQHVALPRLHGQHVVVPHPRHQCAREPGRATPAHPLGDARTSTRQMRPHVLLRRHAPTMPL